jgi:hypothetical protein
VFTQPSVNGGAVMIGLPWGAIDHVEPSVNSVDCLVPTV